MKDWREVSRVRQCAASTDGCSRCGASPRLGPWRNGLCRDACPVYNIAHPRHEREGWWLGIEAPGDSARGEDDDGTPRRTILARAGNRPGNSAGNGACSRGASSCVGGAVAVRVTEDPHGWRADVSAPAGTGGERLRLRSSSPNRTSLMLSLRRPRLTPRLNAPTVAASRSRSATTTRSQARR